jgi:hypothetical protein
MATHAVVIGILVTLVVGLIAGRWLLYPFSALGVVVGSVVFALAARQNLQRIMRHTDYYYYASF